VKIVEAPNITFYCRGFTPVIKNGHAKTNGNANVLLVQAAMSQKNRRESIRLLKDTQRWH